MHRSFEKICPHKPTGRADYFGTLVNRAARLHSATKPGQILVEAPVMEVSGKEMHLAQKPQPEHLLQLAQA